MSRGSQGANQPKTIMFSWPEIEEVRGRAALGRLRRFGATLFRRRARLTRELAEARKG